MNWGTTTRGFVVAFILAAVAGPATAASDDAQPMDKARATMAANAEKAIQAQGGLRILFKVDAATSHEAMLTDLRDDVYRVVREERIPFAGLAMHDGGVEVRITHAEDRERMLGKLKTPAGPHGATIAVSEGSDGSTRLAPTDVAFAEGLHQQVRDSMAMIEQLLRSDGIKQAGLQPDGPDRIRAVLPGVSDPDRVVAMLTKRRQLMFRLVDVSMPPEKALKTAPPPTSEVLYGYKDKAPHLVLKEAVLGGDDIADVEPGLDSRTQQPVVSFRFNGRGARRFAHITADNVGRPFAVVLDDAVLSASVIREPILGGSGQISGNLTADEASTVAMLLRSATPAGRLTVVERQVVAPAGK